MLWGLDFCSPGHMFTLFFVYSYLSEINFFIHVKLRCNWSWCHPALLWSECIIVPEFLLTATQGKKGGFESWLSRPSVRHGGRCGSGSVGDWPCCLQSEMIAGHLTFSLFLIHSRPSAFGRAVALAVQVGLLSSVNPLWGHPFGHP